MSVTSTTGAAEPAMGNAAAPGAAAAPASSAGGATLSAGGATLSGVGRTVDRAAGERAYLGEALASEDTSKPDQLTVKSVNYELDRNRQLHHTEDYELKNLFVRRGQDFDIDVTFSKPPGTEALSLEFTVRGALVESINRGTVVRLSFSHPTPPIEGGWGVRVGAKEGSKYSLVVSCPPAAIVSRYDMAVIIAKNAEDAEPRYFRQLDPIYVLFNAWCPGDGVFLEGDVEKTEYVLNDKGYLYFGTSRVGGQYARAWVFGQFEDTVTEIIFDMLEKHIKEGARSDPVIVARKFTSLINYMPVFGREDTYNGILVGNWSGDYEDGVSPGKWTGSTKIYETHAQSGYEPVKYGQCWVFSGVLNTAMRCLGIPSRSITNFASAHDTDNSMTIDTVYDKETWDEVEYLSGDSVWNFHVWNEVWMSRPDLIPGMGGWQVIDATPQETSEGIYQTGPSPVTAIKQGLTYLNYDTKFCFAEVNADRLTWTAEKRATGKPDMRMIYSTENAVGKFISTKMLPVDGKEPPMYKSRQDVTSNYKYREGSDEERMAVERAVSFGTKPNVYRKAEFKDVNKIAFEIDLEPEIMVGKDFDVKLSVENKDAEKDCNIKLIVNAHVCFYTGVLAKKIHTGELIIKAPPGKSSHVIATMKASEYAKELVEQTCMKFYAFGRVEETSQQVIAQDCIQLLSPELKATVKIIGQEVEVVSEFVNPLPIALTGCTIGFEAARLLRNLTLYPNDVPANGDFKHRMRFSPRQKGKRTLVIDFDSKQLANVMAVVDVDIP